MIFEGGNCDTKTMNYILYEIRTLAVVYIRLMFMFTITAAMCVNSPYTSIIDSEIARLEWLELTQNDFVNATLSAYTSEPTCSRIPISDRTPYNHRTLCPWEYVRDVDENRFPPVLNTAKCMCSSCFDNYQCKPVLYSMPVLLKQCVNGINQWVRKSHLVSVACTCSRPPIRYVKKRLTSLFRLNRYTRRNF